jgi:hypothetical protein
VTRADLTMQCSIYGKLDHEVEQIQDQETVQEEVDTVFDDPSIMQHIIYPSKPKPKE